MERPIEVNAGFLMHGNPIGTGLAKFRDEWIGILNHQVAIKRQTGYFAQRTHHRRADGHIRHKMAVHNIHMDYAAAALGGAADLLRQTRKVSRQNRRCKFNQTQSRSVDFEKILTCKGRARLHTKGPDALPGDLAGGADLVGMRTHAGMPGSWPELLRSVAPWPPAVSVHSRSSERNCEGLAISANAMPSGRNCSLCEPSEALFGSRLSDGHTRWPGLFD